MAARYAAGPSIANRCWAPRPPAGARVTSAWRVPAECVPVRQRMECVSCRGELSWCPPDCRHALARLDFGKRRNRRQDLLLENRTKTVFQHRAEQGQYGRTLLEHLFARSLAGFDETAILARCPERPGHCGAPAGRSVPQAQRWRLAGTRFRSVQAIGAPDPAAETPGQASSLPAHPPGKPEVRFGLTDYGSAIRDRIAIKKGGHAQSDILRQWR